MKRALAPATAVLAVALGACGSSTTNSDEETTTLRVAAAASLTDSFEALEKSFEEEHEDVEVELQLAGSSDLATQVESGADIDVFASADEATMDRVSDLVDDPKVFATNTLTIVTEPGNPQQITGLEDLERKDLQVVVCAPQVPCGGAADELTSQQEVTLDPASEESKVTDVLTKVTTGEADAGLVYVTDAKGAGTDVETVRAEGADTVVNDYPVATLSDGESTTEADAWVEHVTGPEGRKVLSEKGFGVP